MATFVSAIYEYSTEYLEHKKVAGHNMIKTKIIEKKNNSRYMIMKFIKSLDSFIYLKIYRY